MQQDYLNKDCSTSSEWNNKNIHYEILLNICLPNCLYNSTLVYLQCIVEIVFNKVRTPGLDARILFKKSGLQIIQFDSFRSLHQKYLTWSSRRNQWQTIKKRKLPWCTAWRLSFNRILIYKVRSMNYEYSLTREANRLLSIINDWFIA